MFFSAHRLLQIVRPLQRPVLLGMGGTMVVTAGLYFWGQHWAYQQGGPWLEKELEQLLQRPVIVGPVEAVNFNSLRLGPSRVLPSPKDLSTLTLQGLEVKINPLSLMMGKPLTLKAKLVKPVLNLVQKDTGEWLNLNLPQQSQLVEPPVDMILDWTLEQAQIRLEPYQGKPIYVKIQGTGLYQVQRPGNLQSLAYDLQALISPTPAPASVSSNVRAQGKTVFNTGQSQVDLHLEKINLPVLAHLLPIQPLTVEKGNLAGRVQAAWPSLQAVAEAKTQGNLNLEDLQATFPPLKAPLQAQLNLALLGQKIVVRRGQVQLGPLKAQIEGDVDWRQGYNLKVKTNAVAIQPFLKTLAVSLPLQVQGQLQAKLAITGPLAKPVLEGKIENIHPITLDRLPIKSLQTQLRASLTQFTLQSLTLQPQAGGILRSWGHWRWGQGQPLKATLVASLATSQLLQAYDLPTQGLTLGPVQVRGTVGGTWRQPLAQLRWYTQTPSRLGALVVKGAGEAQWQGQTISFKDVRLQTNGGELQLQGSGDWGSDRWEMAVEARQFSLHPFLLMGCRIQPCPGVLTSKPLTLSEGRWRSQGSWRNFSPASVQARGNFTLRSGTEKINAQAQLHKGRFLAQAQVRSLELSPWWPQLPKGSTLKGGEATLTGTLTDWQTIDLAKLQGQTNGRLAIAASPRPLFLQGAINGGMVTAVARGGEVNLQRLMPQLPLTASLTQGQVTLLAPLTKLWRSPMALVASQDFEAIAALDLTVAGGQIKSLSRLTTQGWQSRLRAQNLNLAPLAPTLTAPFSGTLNLRGVLPQGPNGPLPVAVETARLEWGANRLQTQGHLLVTNPWRSPQLQSLNLTLSGQQDLQTLPLQSLLADGALPPSWQPQSINLRGQAQLRGTLQGQDLQSWQDLQLKGELSLHDLELNGAGFDTSLQGPILFDPRHNSKLALRGQKDHLEINFAPLTQSLLPTGVDLHLGSSSPEPLQITAHRQGHHLQLNLQSLPLALLNLQPGREYNLLGPLRGQLKAQGKINLHNFSGQGQIAIDNWGIGFLKSERFETQVSLQDHQLELKQARLQLGQSHYQMMASLNLQTQAIAARLTGQGKVNELLSTLRIQDIDSIVRLTQNQPLPTASSLPPLSLGNAQRPLEHQLNLLYVVDQKIRALAQQQFQGGAPSELNIDGNFQGEINLAGTLYDPQLALSLRGKRWSWYPQPVFANIIPPLGLVLNSNRFVPINEVNLQVLWQDGQVTIPPSFVEVRSARLGIAGQLSPHHNNAQWAIENFSSDILALFVPLPLDLVGTLNARGKLQGSWLRPQLQGSFKLDELSLKARSLKFNSCPETECILAGNFSYGDNQFRLNTDRHSPLFIAATIPYRWSNQGPPLQSKNFEIQAHVKEDAFQLLGPLTDDQLTWVGGQGDINVGIRGQLESGSELRLKDFQALGRVQLNSATVKSAILPNPIQVSGTVQFNDQMIGVEKLTGDFGQGEVEIQGNLPLFKPQVNLPNPLTVNLDPTQIKFPNLYQGQVAGLVEVKGTAFAPQLSGQVYLSDGQVSPPTPMANATNTVPENFWLRRRLQNNGESGPALKNLQINLENLAISQDPLYSFAFGGTLNLSGPLANIQRLQPQGQINLYRGRVSFLDTRFLLDRRTPNSLTFNPQQGLLNPNLRLAMRTIVSDLPQSQRLRSADSNEIPDDSITKIQRVDVRLVIDSALSRILPNLNTRNVEICHPEQVFRPLSGEGTFADYQLENLSECLQLLAAQGFNNEQLLSNPAIQLTSSPPRSEGEIVRLLGQQAIVLVDALQGKNADQLLQVGITQLAIPMIFQGLVYDVETALGKQLGTTDMRIVPFLETVYTVEKNGYIRLSYDYSINEVRLRYEKQF